MDSEKGTGNGKLKVAIVGSGMGGLSAAWLLSNHNVEVHLFESQPQLGLGSHSIDLATGQPSQTVTNEEIPRAVQMNEEIAHRIVDIPARIFVSSYYRELPELFKAIGVEVEKANGAPSYGLLDRPSLFRMKNILIGSFSFTLFLSWRVFSFGTWVRIISDSLCFAWQARQRFISRSKGVGKSKVVEDLESMTLDQYLTKYKYSSEFTSMILLPLFCVICTCSTRSVLDYPAHVVSDFFYCLVVETRGMERAKFGTFQICSLLAKKINNLHLGKAIQGIKYGENQKPRVVDGEGSETTFDHVIVATQANQASEMLIPTEKDLRVSNEAMETLKSFTYENSSVVLHRDPNLMPRDKEDWRGMNMIVDPNSGEVMCTVWQTILQPSFKCGDDIFQTWNPLRSVENDKLIASAWFQRPVVTATSEKAVDDLKRYQGRYGIWFCGAYVLHGVPLLENACSSGLSVAEEILGGKRLRPWKECPPRGSGSLIDFNTIAGAVGYVAPTLVVFFILVLALYYALLSVLLLFY